MLAEKPLAEEMEEAIDIVRQAEAHGRQVMVGMNFRYLATSQALRRIFREQMFGAPGFAISSTCATATAGAPYT